MKWQHKARIQNAIAALPFASNAVYYAVQRSVGGLRPEKIDPLDRMKAAAGMVSWAKSAGFDIRGKAVLEVGTGRMVDLPTGLWLAGAGRVITVDLNPYLSPRLISDARSFIRRNREKVIDLFERKDDPLFEERLEVLVGTTVSDDGLLRAMNVEYMSPADAANLPLDAGTIDLHVSHTVLEHIPAEVLAAILKEARRLLRPGGLLIHNIDPSDHFSHDDPAISRINFLRFDESEWDKWAGNQFMYHNRLRAKDYVRIFADAGVRTLKEARSVDDRSLAVLNDGFVVSDRFRGIPKEELATTSYSIMGSFD
jgi:SAM-dependent methyltransferase